MRLSYSDENCIYARINVRKAGSMHVFRINIVCLNYNRVVI